MGPDDALRAVKLLQPQKVLKTAQFMALFRALETARPARRRLFGDPFAAGFLDPAEI